jgi:hypothetical protein
LALLPDEVLAMSRLPLFAILTAAALGVGCASMNVSSYVDQAADFTEFATFDWGAPDNLPTGDPRLDNNPFFRDYLMGAVEKQLAARGYRRASDRQPQLLVHYHANVAQRFEVHGLEPTNYPNCMPNCEPAIVEYEEGTIVVDVVNAATGDVVWRGWAQGDLRVFIDDQDAMHQHVVRSVERMFEALPAGAVTAR